MGLGSAPLPDRPPIPKTQQVRSDRIQLESHCTCLEANNLGEYASASACLFRQQGWEKMVLALRANADLQPSVCNLPHLAAHVLNHLHQHGAPIVMCTPPWPRSRQDTAVTRGPHLSAKHYLAFLEQEMLAMVQKGQWLILSYATVASLPNLRLSPLGVVPQRDRHPCTIADYTFSGVIGDTVPLTDHLPLQFGWALLCILHKIITSDPAFGPVYLLKLDMADGFYRIHLAPHHVPLLGVVFPTLMGQPALVAFPLALPMGWTSSPPFFCAATETVTDLTNTALQALHEQPPHRLETIADPFPTDGIRIATQPAFFSPNTNAQPSTNTAPLAWSDVFVDDHIALAQGNPVHLQHVCRTLLHQINRVFRPLDPGDHPSQQEPISTKKLAKGDGQWST